MLRPAPACTGPDPRSAPSNPCSLFATLQISGPLSEQQSALAMRTVLSALDACHSAGIQYGASAPRCAAAVGAAEHAAGPPERHPRGASPTCLPHSPHSAQSLPLTRLPRVRCRTSSPPTCCCAGRPPRASPWTWCWPTLGAASTWTPAAVPPAAPARRCLWHRRSCFTGRGWRATSGARACW